MAQTFGPYDNVLPEPGAVTASNSKTLRNRAVKVLRTVGVRSRGRRRR